MSDGCKKPWVRPVEASISRRSRRYQILVRLEDIDAFVCSDIPGKMARLSVIVWVMGVRSQGYNWWKPASVGLVE